MSALLSVMVTACSTGDEALRRQEEVAGNAPAPHEAKGESTAGAETEIELLGPGEVALHRERGRGSRPAIYQFNSRGRFHAYARCSGGSDMRLRDSQSGTVQMEVPCDGVISRSQVFTDRGTAVRIVVVADPDIEWELLIADVRRAPTG